MQPEDYESALALAEERNFGRAAARLGISQPALSARVQRIEGALGARLFVRGRGGAEATAAGLAFAEAARRVLDAMAEAKRAAASAAAGRGRLRVGFTAIAAHNLAVPILVAYGGREPRVSLSVSEANTARLERALEEGAIDVAVLHPPLHGTGLAEAHLGEQRAMAALLGDGGGGAAGALHIADAARLGLIVFARAGAPVLMGALHRAAGAAATPPEAAGADEADTVLGALVLAAAGRGVALVPEGFPVPPRLRLLEIDGLSEPLRTVVAWRRTDRRQAVRSFVTAACDAGRADGSS